MSKVLCFLSICLPAPLVQECRIFFFRIFSLTHNWSFLLFRVVQESLGLKETQIIGRIPQVICHRSLAQANAISSMLYAKAHDPWSLRCRGAASFCAMFGVGLVPGVHPLWWTPQLPFSEGSPSPPPCLTPLSRIHCFFFFNLLTI